MSRLYNYFASCWTFNPNFTEEQLDTAVAKGYLTTDEATAIKAIPKAI
jgi:hypothetical protein